MPSLEPSGSRSRSNSSRRADAAGLPLRTPTLVEVSSLIRSPSISLPFYFHSVLTRGGHAHLSPPFKVVPRVPSVPTPNLPVGSLPSFPLSSLSIHAAPRTPQAPSQEGSSSWPRRQTRVLSERHPVGLGGCRVGVVSCRVVSCRAGLCWVVPGRVSYPISQSCRCRCCCRRPSLAVNRRCFSIVV
jgi:hypothetical protein